MESVSSHFKAKIHELPINDDCGFLSAGLFCGCVRFDRSLKTYVDHRFMILSVCVAQGFISLSLVHSIYTVVVRSFARSKQKKWPSCQQQQFARIVKQITFEETIIFEWKETQTQT